MSKNQRNGIILLGIVLVLILVGIVATIQYNQRLQSAHNEFADRLTNQQAQVDATLTALFTH